MNEKYVQLIEDLMAVSRSALHISKKCEIFAVNAAKLYESTAKAPNPDNKAPDSCDCNNWASDGRLPLLSHHRNCPAYMPITELMEIISGLIRGVESWGAEENGIYPECYDAYKRAKTAMGQFDFFDKSAE